MHSIRDADVVIALGTRLSPFGTLPQYGEDYWPKDAKIIQVRHTVTQLSHNCHTTVTLLSQYHTVTLSRCHTVTLPHCHTVTLSHWHTATVKQPLL